MSEFLSGPVEISVPATSANLGPGYDSLGLALDLRDRVTAEVSTRGLHITVAGQGAGEVPLDEGHLVHRAMVRTFEEMGCPVPGLALRCENVIPHGRGLGSSSAAIVGGICAARALVPDGSLRMGDEAAFSLAAELEGHPDNVAPAFFGGFTIAYADGSRFSAANVSVDPRVHVVVFVPTTSLETKTARAVLPDVVPHAAAADNAARAALLVVAMNCQPERLLAATEDRIHQNYRATVMPQTLRLVRELRGDGVPAVVSGAGPSVLAFHDGGDPARLRRRSPSGWQALLLHIDPDGVRVSEPMHEPHQP